MFWKFNEYINNSYYIMHTQHADSFFQSFMHSHSFCLYVSVKAVRAVIRVTRCYTLGPTKRESNIVRVT